MDAKRKVRPTGAIWESVLTDEEADAAVSAVPEVPENLVRRTLDACAQAIALDVRWHVSKGPRPFITFWELVGIVIFIATITLIAIRFL